MRLIRSAALVLLTGALALIGARPVSSQTEVQSAAYMPDLAEVMNLESSEIAMSPTGRASSAGTTPRTPKTGARG